MREGVVRLLQPTIERAQMNLAGKVVGRLLDTVQEPGEKVDGVSILSVNALSWISVLRCLT